jgi:hypothetical protein
MTSRASDGAEFPLCSPETGHRPDTDASEGVLSCLQEVAVVVTVNGLQRLDSHAEIACSRPHIDAELHQPRRSCMSQDVRGDIVTEACSSPHARIAISLHHVEPEHTAIKFHCAIKVRDFQMNMANARAGSNWMPVGCSWLGCSRHGAPRRGYDPLRMPSRYDVTDTHEYAFRA